MSERTDKVLSRYEALQRALIDASSIIYMDKAGFLERLADAVKLYAPTEVLAETGLTDKNIEEVQGDSISGSADEKLIACAQHLGWPLISEDKKILSTMRRDGIPYFNALMMVHFLLFRKRIEPADHARYLKRLEEIAWYSPQVLAFGRRIHEAVKHRNEDDFSR